MLNIIVNSQARLGLRLVLALCETGNKDLQLVLKRNGLRDDSLTCFNNRFAKP